MIPQKSWLKTLRNVLHFVPCKLMQAPHFLSSFIHWDQMFFFSLSMQRLFFPFRGRYSNPGVIFFFNTAKKTPLHNFCTYTTDYTREQYIDAEGKHSFWFGFWGVFLLSFSHEVKSLSLFFFWQICIKFYGDYQHNCCTVGPLPVSVIQGSSSYTVYIQISWMSLTVMENHIKTALSLIYFSTP